MLRVVAPLLLLLISGATAAPLLHAVVPDLPGPGPGDEGFALISETQFDLSGWTITDDEGAWTAPNGTHLLPGEPFWVTGNADVWSAHDGPPAALWTDDALRLSNDGETLRLLDASGNEVDSLEWTGTTAARIIHTEPTPRDHRLGESDLPQPTFQVDAVTAYASPDNTYRILRELIDGAEARLVAHVYSFRHGELTEALVDATERGVDVAVMVDGNVVGASREARDATAWYLNDLLDAGADAVVSGGAIHRHHHLKVLVADDAVAIQSENWGRTGVPTAPITGNRGWGVVLHDADVADWFAEWMAEDRQRWDVEMPPERPASAPPLMVPDAGRYAPKAAVHFDGPIPVTPLIAPDHTAHEGLLLERIQGATERIWTQQLKMDDREKGGLNWDRPDRFVTALTASDADVRVHLAAPFSSSDPAPWEVHDALADGGVSVRFWDHPTLGTLHNKGWIIDDAVVVGSMNGHHASRANNREVSVLIDSAEVADQYASWFQADARAQALGIPAASVPMLLALMAVVVALRRP